MTYRSRKRGSIEVGEGRSGGKLSCASQALGLAAGHVVEQVAYQRVLDALSFYSLGSYTNLYGVVDGTLDGYEHFEPRRRGGTHG